ncbi:MAG: SDR family NAD(P)-dependent oxidoreductase [Cyanobacteriota bacterium]|nr:SDR family NAD(P)-dependent oxidoreductase [Cyanobacteriota bacterium]
MAGRFPGAPNLDVFEANLSQGKESIRHFSSEELLAAGIAPELIARPDYVRAAPILDDFDCFDASFFGFSARDAELTDPQHRVFLQVAHSALEHAGYGSADGERNIGVFGGSGSVMGSYLIGDRVNENLIGFIASREHIGNDKDHLCTRVSHRLNLHGPSVTVQTACSTSLVAVHLACQSLLNGECEMALAGGVTIRNPQYSGYLYREGDIFSPDGHCRTFDEAAAGTLFGSGAGIVVLRPLLKALEAGDTIHAVIRGTAINNDGGGKFSYWSTNPQGQTEAIVRALSKAAVDAETIGYLEAHGTATRLGDMMETLALKNAFTTERRGYCGIGSVKTNIGHTDAAAGIAGLLKTILSLRSRRLFANLHFQRPNPRIDFEQSPFRVITSTCDWPDSDHPRRAGVNSLGVGGTNAHAILEEAPLQGASHPAQRRFQVLPISAKDEDALVELTTHYVALVVETPNEALPDLCHTAAVGRAHHALRRCAVGNDPLTLADALLAAPLHRVAAGTRPGRRGGPKLAFLFTGQGAQVAGMGRGLYDSEPVVRTILDRCEAIATPLLGTSLLGVMFGEDNITLQDTAYTQPALFTLEVALAALWRSWGVIPDLVLGHSVGELAAACVAGVFSMEDGLRLVIARARLMSGLPRAGGMAAVQLPEAEARELLKPYGTDLTIAVINGPSSVVLSGHARALDAVLAYLQAREIRHRRLAVSHAFHSPLVEPILDALAEVTRTLPHETPRLPLVSNRTGAIADPHLISPDYWLEHARQPVRFADGLATLAREGARLFVEIGPDTTLLGMARTTLDLPDAIWLPSLKSGRPDDAVMAEALAALYCQGIDPDWSAYSGDHRRRIPLPTYPFRRERHWLEPSPPRLSLCRVHPLIDRLIRSPLVRESIYETDLSAEHFPYLADHKVGGSLVVPGALFLAIALSACASNRQGQPTNDPAFKLRLDDTIFPQPLRLDVNEQKTLQLVVTPDGRDGTSFQLISLLPGADHQSHASGRFVDGIQEQPALALHVLRDRCDQPVPPDRVVEIAARRGIDFGPAFRWFEAAFIAPGEGLGRLRVPPGLVLDGPLHPGLLDACFQLASTLVDDPERAETPLPFSVGSLRCFAPSGPGPWWCHAQACGPLQWDITLLDDRGCVIAQIERFSMRVSDLANFGGSGRWKDWLLEMHWQCQASFGLWPPPLPDLSAIAAKAAVPAQELLAAPELAAHEAALADLETLSLNYVVASFARLGIALLPGDTLHAGQLASQLGVLPSQRRLFDRLFVILAEAGFLAAAGGQTWTVMQTPKAADPEQVRQNLMERHGALLTPELALLGRCGAGLDAALRGAVEALNLLFPGGDVRDATRLYNDTPRARALNGIVRQTLQAVLACLPPGRGLRILEIGGGTGGTTATLLPALPADRVRYTFTDIGALFVSRARESFGEYEFLEARSLDIGLDPLAQGFRANSFDLVLAVNVLHATPDMPTTMDHVRKLLAPGGLLVLSESTKSSWWCDLIFGLTREWWCFSDARRQHPLLTVDAWTDLLSRSGFHAPTCVPDASPALANQGQVVLVARADDGVTPMDGPWLILAEPSSALCQDAPSEGSLANALAASLHRRRQGASVLSANEAADPAALEDRLRDRPWHGVVDLRALTPWSPQDSGPTLEQRCQGDTQGVLQLVQALVRGGGNPPALWLVSRDAQAVRPADRVSGFAQAGLWGFGRVVSLEHPELRCTLVDLDGQQPCAEQAEALCAELMGVDALARESEVALRGGLVPERWVSRLRPRSALSDLPEPRRMEIADRGSLDGLSWQLLARRQPDPDEVEIRITATALNFIDLLDVLGALPFQRGQELGGECVGRVVAVGERVSRLRMGDRVVALAWGSLATHVTVHADRVAAIPDSLPDFDAVTLPIAYGTAMLALFDAGRLRPGERVLIHAAAGGTGLAALALARAAGAEVYATASIGKWEIVRAAGARAVYDSRSLDFADQLLADTDGQGVDLVLNSLTGEGFVARGLDVLRPGGRFIELAKREVWSQEAVRAYRPDVAHHVVDLRATIDRDPSAARPLLEDTLSRVTDGTLPALPREVYPATDVRTAFSRFQQARQVGKLVICQATTPDARIRPDASYAITGGLGGLGLRMAAWLVDQGARHVVLIGRHGPDAATAARLTEFLRDGADVRALVADVTDRDALAAALAEAGSQAPLRGVIHAPGVLDDGALLAQSWSRFSTVLGPKVWGAWNVHSLTLDAPLDFFVLFSSVAGLLGNAGQANHAFGNAFLGALAHWRRASGLPALCIDWGPWASIGAAATGVRDFRGFLPPEEGVEAFERLLRSEAIQVAVLPDQGRHYLGQRPVTPTLAALLPRANAASDGGKTPIPAFSTAWEQAAAEDRTVLLMRTLRAVTATVLGVRPEQIEPRQGLRDLGLDSLMSIELRNRLGQALERRLPATLAFDHPTLEALFTFVLAELTAEESSSGTGDGRDASGDTDAVVTTNDAESVDDDRSEEEAAALLMHKLNRLGL